MNARNFINGLDVSASLRTRIADRVSKDKELDMKQQFAVRETIVAADHKLVADMPTRSHDEIILAMQIATWINGY
jgi:hypothetical protein